MSKNSIHSKSGLDRILTANAVSSFIGVPTDANVSTGEHRRRAAGNVASRAAILRPDSHFEAMRLYDQAMAYAWDATAAFREEYAS